MTEHTQEQRIALGTYLSDYDATVSFDFLMTELRKNLTGHNETITPQQYYEDWDGGALAQAIEDLADTLKREYATGKTEKSTLAEKLERIGDFAVLELGEPIPIAVIRKGDGAQERFEQALREHFDYAQVTITAIEGMSTTDDMSAVVAYSYLDNNDSRNLTRGVVEIHTTWIYE